MRPPPTPIRYTYSERWLFVILTTFSDGTLRTLLRPLASLAVFSLCLWALPAAGLLPPLPPTSSEPHQVRRAITASPARRRRD